MSERSVLELLSTHYVTADSDSSVGKVTDLMLEEDVSTALIVDATGRMVGLVSESAILAAAFDPPRQAEPISLYMQRKFVSIDAAATLTQVVETFLRNQVRHLPVLRNGHAVGIVSRRQLLKALAAGGLDSWTATMTATDSAIEFLERSSSQY